MLKMTRGIAGRKRRIYRRPSPIVAAAREFGVAYEHLRQVLKGQRVSHRLTRRYREWEEQQQAAQQTGKP